MTNATWCSDAPTTDPCARCVTLLGLPGVYVEAVERTEALVTVIGSTRWQLMGCPTCGVVAPSRGRRRRELHDVPGIVPVRLVWRQRTWRCPDRDCSRGTFVEQVRALVTPRGSLTVRAVDWAIGQLRREHATVQGLSRQLGVDWKTRTSSSTWTGTGSTPRRHTVPVFSPEPSSSAGSRWPERPRASAERTRRLSELDDVFDWLPFDLASTRSYGLVAASARLPGAMVRGKDALIAAQAHRFNAAVMIANLAGFRPFDQLVPILAPTPR